MRRSGERTDAERLDWLEDFAKSFDFSLGQEDFSKRFVVWSEHGEFDWQGTGPTLRYAIDRAMEKDEARKVPA